jgi:hypothetical protein
MKNAIKKKWCNMKYRFRSREEILEQLSSLGITGKDVYFIDYIPLIEMIWADGMAQKGEVDILYDFLKNHVLHLNQTAGYKAFKLEDAVKFVSRFLRKRPSPEILKTLRNLAACSGCCREDHRKRELFKDSMLAICIDIAASSVTKYPYGLHERFNAAEKKCFFEILNAFEAIKAEDSIVIKGPGIKKDGNMGKALPS